MSLVTVATAVEDVTDTGLTVLNVSLTSFLEDGTEMPNALLAHIDVFLESGMVDEDGALTDRGAYLVRKRLRDLERGLR
ncbi:MAG TPA: hypothetical protein VMT27_09870 [Actinomycetes bacterium]|nr:hypothetical protein [Actinomycetes bacterium]